jgi:hypothetical protein
MTKIFTILLFIGLAWGQDASIDNEIGRQFWVAILLFLVIRGAIKVGKWEGSKSRIKLYRIGLPLFSFINILFFGAIVGIQPVYDKPLFYILLQIIILHFGLRNKASQWVNASNSESSNEIIISDTTVSKSEEIDIEKQLEKLKGMLDKDLITQDDYDAKKKELLGL